MAPTQTPATANTPFLLDVRDLKKHFAIRKGLLRRVVGYVYAVDGVSLTLRHGETLGVVGESGCGKSTTRQDHYEADEPTSAPFGSAARTSRTLTGRPCGRSAAKCR